MDNDPKSSIIISSGGQPGWQRVLGLPRTRIGWWSVGLASGFVVLFGFNAVAALIFQWNFRAPFLLIVGCAIAALILGLISMVRYKERSWLIMIALLIGLFTLYIIIALLIPIYTI
jgi:hypothetical protein